jgi:hypothetical protein
MPKLTPAGVSVGAVLSANSGRGSIALTRPKRAVKPVVRLKASAKVGSKSKRGRTDSDDEDTEEDFSDDPDEEDEDTEEEEEEEEEEDDDDDDDGEEETEKVEADAMLRGIAMVVGPKVVTTKSCVPVVAHSLTKPLPKQGVEHTRKARRRRKKYSSSEDEDDDDDD